MSLNCVITDDEPIAVEILEDYFKKVPGLTIVAKCANVNETMLAIRTDKIDVLFMDIQMPAITGIEYVKTLFNPPIIILTTAYPEYAIEGFDLNVTDYLLKPFSFERFLKAVNKIYNRPKPTHVPVPHSSSSPSQNFFFVKSSYDLVKVYYDEVLYLEGMENYVRIHCDNGIITALTSMKNIENLLSFHNFMRIHKSYIINLSKVSSVRNMVFTIGNRELETGNVYREKVGIFIRKNSPS